MQKPGTLLGQRHQVPELVDQSQAPGDVSTPVKPVRDGQRLPVPDPGCLVL